MKFFTSRFNFKAIGKTMVVPGVGAALVITLSTMNGCSQSDRSTESRDEVIAQNAAEAEADEEKMAAPKAEEKTEKAEKSKSKKTAKAEPKAEHKAEQKAEHKAEQKTAAAPAQHETRKPAAAGGVFVVQVGAFKVKENAEKLQEKLAKAGYHVEMQVVDHSKNGTLHLVRFQPVTNRAEAETMIEDLHSKHDLQAQIVTVPSATATH